MKKSFASLFFLATMPALLVFRFRENLGLQFRWEMFNALNHANLAIPRSNITAARPGQIDGTSDPRIMQGGLRLTF